MKKHLTLVTIFFFNFFLSQDFLKLTNYINKDLSNFESTNAVDLFDKEDEDNSKIFTYYYNVDENNKKLLRVYTDYKNKIKKIVWFEDNEPFNNWKKNNSSIIDSRKFKSYILIAPHSNSEKAIIYKKSFARLIKKIKRGALPKFDYTLLYSNGDIIIMNILKENEYMALISESENFKKDEDSSLYEDVTKYGKVRLK